jgi:hypothetical protein
MYKLGEFVDSIMRNLKEQTASANIGYLPGGFLKAKKALGPLARTKKDWGVKVIENGDGYKISFEDVLEFGIPDKKAYEEFNNKVVKVHGMTIVSLSKILQEALDTFKTNAYEDLEFNLTKKLSSIPQVSTTIDLISYWNNSFPGSKPSVYLGNAISVSKFKRDIGEILRQLSDKQSIGDMQMISKAIKDQTSMDAIAYFVGRDYLIGDILVCEYEGVDLEFHCFVDLSLRVNQVIKVDDLDVCAEMEYYREVRIVKDSLIYPVSGTFSPSLFENLKDVIEDVTGRDK